MWRIRDPVPVARAVELAAGGTSLYAHLPGVQLTQVEFSGDRVHCN